jgi:hypothetical protein
LGCCEQGFVTTGGRKRSSSGRTQERTAIKIEHGANPPRSNGVAFAIDIKLRPAKQPQLTGAREKEAK